MLAYINKCGSASGPPVGQRSSIAPHECPSPTGLLFRNASPSANLDSRNRTLDGLQGDYRSRRGARQAEQEALQFESAFRSDRNPLGIGLHVFDEGRHVDAHAQS